jgi:hypothetical protein
MLSHQPALHSIARSCERPRTGTRTLLSGLPKELMQAPTPPDGIVCANDELAAGAILGLREVGISAVRGPRGGAGVNWPRAGRQRGLA